MKKLHRVIAPFLVILMLCTGCVENSFTKQENRFFKEIHVKGTPYEMGYQHGEQCKELIAKAREWAKIDGGATEMCEAQSMMGVQLNLTEITRWIAAGHSYRATLLENSLNETAPELLEEIRGIADGSDQSYEDILFLNAAGESGGCSSWAAVGSATIDGHS